MKRQLLKLGMAVLLAVLFTSKAVTAATVSWVGGSGDWTNTANWSTGALPGTNDNVVISPAATITITHSAGTHTVKSVQSSEAFVLSGGSLTVSNTFQSSNTFTLSGGTLQIATVITTNGYSLVVQSGTLDGVTVNGVLDVGDTYNGANLTMTNGLTLNGTCYLGNPTNGNIGGLSFAGNQTLGGNGTVVFGDDNYYGNWSVLRLANAGTTLTIGPGITVRGQNGVIGSGSGYWLGGPTSVAVLNQGTISCDVSGGTIIVNAQPFSNAGLARGINGGTLSISGTGWSNSGALNVATNSTLTFSGNGTNTGTLNATNGTVNLGGSLTTAQLGVVNQQGGTINLTGALDNTGSSLALHGPWALNGSIRNGTVLATNGYSLVVQSGTLDGVTVNGVLDVGDTYNGANLTMTNGLTLNGTCYLGNPTNGNIGGLSFAGNQTLGGNGTVVFGDDNYYGNWSVLRLANAGTTLTIGPGITVRGQNGVIGSGSGYWLGGPTSVAVLNQGTISCDVSGGTIIVNAQPFSNAGLARGINGGTLSISGTGWSNSGALNVATNSTLTFSGNGTNTGTLNATNGTVNLGGSLTTAQLGVVNQQGGTINLTGALDNTGSSLALHGPWALNGSIRNGTVLATNGYSLVVQSGTLDGVTVNGVLDVGDTYNGANLTMTNGLTLNGTCYLGNPTNGNIGGLSFAGNQTLGGNGTVVFGDDNYYGNWSVLRLANAGTTLTIGPGITVRGQNGVIGSGSGYWLGGPTSVAVLNQGTISCDVSGGTIIVNAQPFSNAGLARGINGGTLSISGTGWSNSGALNVATNSTLTFSGNGTNTGTLNATNGTVNLGGSLTTAQLGVVNQQGGTINLTGALDNTGSSLALHGPWALNGSIRNGTVLATNGYSLVVQSGTLDGVTVNGVLDVGDTYNGANLTMTNGLTLNGTCYLGNPTNGNIGGLSFAGNQTLGGNGTVVFGDDNYYGNWSVLRLANAGTTLTIGPGITVRGQNGVIGSGSGYWLGGPTSVAVLNQGTISCDVSGGTIIVNAQPFSNAGLARGINGGTLSISGTGWSNSGALNVATNSTLTFSGNGTNTGTLNATNGTVNLGGSLTTAQLGVVNQQGGTINLTGALDNTGSSLALHGPWALNGSIRNGTVLATNGYSLVVQSGTLDGVTVNGVLDVGDTYNGANLTMTNGLTLNGTCYLGNPTNGNIGGLSFAGNQTLGGNGTVVFGDDNYYGNWSVLRLANAGTTLTIGPGITVRGQNGVIGSGSGYWLGGPTSVAVLNQGTISCDVSGGTIIVNAQPFSNAGLARGINGGTLSISGTGWSNSGALNVATNSTLTFSGNGTNTGTLNATNGTVNLGGSLTTAQLGVVNQQGGTINLTGALDNTGSSLALHGPWALNGSIRNGTVLATNGYSLVVQSGTLDGVTVNGVLDVGDTYNGANLTMTNGLTLNGTCYLGNPTNGNIGGLSFAGNQTLGGNGTVVFGDDNYYGNWSVLRLANAGTTLTIGPGITVRGQNGVIGSGSGYWLGGPTSVAVLNQGTISCDVSGGTIIVNAQPFSNAGLARGINGGTLSISGTGWSNSGALNVATNSTLTFSGNGTNTGTLNATNGTVNLGGSLTTAQLGVVNQQGGTINLTGALDNTGSSLALHGPWALNGSIRNGTVLATNGYSLVVQSGTLDGVTVNGVLDVGDTYNGANLTMTNGLTLNGTCYLGNPTNGNIGGLSFAGNQTLGGNGTVVFGDDNYYGNWSVLRLANAGTTLTIGPGITVRGQNGVIGSGSGYWLGGPTSVAVLNQGTISCDVSGGTIIVNAQPFSNAGLARGINGGTLSISGTGWSNSGALNVATNSTLTFSGNGTNTGTLNATNGTVNLGGSLTTAQLGVVNQQGGTINLTGALDNTGSSLALHGPWALNGSIRNGTVLATNGYSLVVQSGTLDGVTVNGVLDVGDTYNGANLTMTNGLTLNGTCYLGNPTNGNIGGLSFAGNQTLGGNGTVVFGDDNYYGNWSVLRLANAGTTLTIGPGITVRGQNGVIGSGSGYWLGGPTSVAVLNQGTISCDVSGGTIIVNAQPFSNAGLARGINGGTLSISGTGWSNSGALNVATNSTLTFSGNGTNTGTLNATNGTVNLGGSLTTAQLGVVNQQGGTINLTGALDNTGSSLALHGPWALNGSIRNGTVLATNGYSLVVQSGTLDGVTVNGVLDVGDTYNGANLTMTNGLTLNGTCYLGNPTNGNIGGLSFAGNQTLGGNGTVVFGDDNYYGNWSVLRLANAGTTLTIGPGITVRGQNGVIGSGSGYWLGGPTSVAVLNQGTISCDVSGGTIYVTAQPFTDSGTLNVSSGEVLTLNSGVTLDDPGFINSQIGGTLNLTGSLLGNTHNSSQYNPQGNLVFTSGTNSLEAMSSDMGNVSAGYINNFAYGTISLQSGVVVKLVDQYTNSSGTPPECVYVHLLVVPSGSTLNLNGLHLYAGLSQISGTILGGTVSPVPAPTITIQPQSQTATIGTNVTFNVVAYGTAPLSYQWQFNSTNLANNAQISGASSTNLSIANVVTNDAGNYQVILTNTYGSATSAVAVLTVVKRTPVLTWTNPAAITYGTPLGSNQLNASSGIPGTFVYNPAAGAILNAGTSTLSVLFTPNDTVDYNSVIESVTLSVLQVPLSVTASNAIRPYGQSNPVFTGRITGLTNGDNITANYSCSATPGSFPGTYPIVPSLVDPYNRQGNYQVSLINGILTVTNGPAPDLQVISVTMPAQAWTGRSFDVNWGDTNAGLNVAIGPWVDNVYLSATNQLNTNQDRLLGQFAFSGTLNQGQAVQRIQTVTINSQGISNGLYYISVLTDATNSVYEGSNETNNVGISATNINVQVTPLPDLVVASVDAPSTGIGGQPVGVSWIVCNQGAADTDVPLWFDHLYLSTTTNLTGVVEDYGEYENPSYLIAGDCYEQYATVTLPIGVSGPYYFIVNADCTDLVGDDTIANTLGSTTLPMNIQLVTPGFFHVASAQVAPAPPTVTWPGQQITCTYIVQNIGQSPITGVWDDRITLSSVSNFVNGVTTVFAYENDIGVAGPLAPGSTYTNSAQFTLPQSVAGTNVTGTWYVVPVVDIHFAAGGNGFGTGSIGRDELAAPLDVSAPPPSDLQVTSVSAPTKAIAGQPINVGWTVANNGNNQTSSGYWYDAIYLSTNSTFNLNQSTLIGTYGHFGVLGLTSNYTQNVSLTVPANLLGTNTYYLFVDADAGNAVYELDKTNNVLGAANPLVIQQAPPTLLADLAVTAVAAPWTAIQGSQVNITWAVTNQGAGATSVGSWMDSVYLSPSTKLNLASAQLLGFVVHNGILAPGGSYTQSQMFDLPYCAVGSNYVVVFVDSGAEVNEGGATNNNLLAAYPAMHIWPGNAARLGVSAVNPATNVLAGSPLTVSWTVGNSGNATTTAPWVDALYLSMTPQFVWTNTYLLGLYTNVANLASGGSYTRTLSPTVPRCFSGTYYVAVVTDIGNAVNSISCNTNDFNISSAPVQIVPSGYASLQIASLALPAAVNSGYPWTVQWTVTNAGPSAASGTWSDVIYASLLPTLDETAILLGQFAHTNTLASGASYTQTQSVAFPSCLSGNYYIYAVADVSNRVNSTTCVVNNQASSATPLTVNVGPYPDLVVNSVEIPATAYASQSMPISWSVTNAGSATANGPWLDSVYLSTSSTFSSNNSVFLGSYPYNVTLAPGAAYSQSTSFTLPNTTHGNFYVYVATDSSNAVNECQGETNNVTGSSSVLNVPVTLYPDLHVTTVQVPGTAYAGQTINISWVVTNDGTDTTSGSTVWNDAVFLSADEVLDPSDTRLGTFTRPISLGIGQSYTNSVSVQIPPSAAGPYYILVLADSAGSLFEYLGYNDSLGWNPYAMIVSLPPPADLAATNVTLAPAAGVPGSTVTIGWNVQNLASNNIPATWTDNVYLSTNNVWDINAVMVVSQNHSGLAANAGYSASWTGPLPALTTGSYHAIVWTDVRNTAQETNLANNIAVSANTIAVDVPVLVLGQPVTNQLTTGSAQYYKVNVPAGQTVSVTLTGAATNSFNELYVRYGAVPDLGDYDFLYSTPFSPNQQISIPTTQAGWYYIMLRGGNEPGGPLGYTLEASIIPFAISGVSQNHIGDNGQVTITLTGAQFQSGATVELVSGTNTYFSQTNFFHDATSVAARFMFTNAVHGIYDVVLTNPSNQSTTDSQAVTIETALPLTAQVVPGLVNNHPRVGLPFEWNGAVANAGNVDIQYLTVAVILGQPFNIVLNPPSVAVFADTNSTDNTAGGCAFIARNLPPSASIGFSFAVSGFSSQIFNYYIVPTAQSKQNFLSQVADEAEAVRDYALAATNGLALITTNSGGVVTTNTLSFPPALIAALATTNAWENFFALGLVAGNLLDTNDLASLPPPSSEGLASQLAIMAQPKITPASITGCEACDTAKNLEEKIAMAAFLTELVHCALEAIGCQPCGALCVALATAGHLATEAYINASYKNCECANNCIPSCSGGGTGGGSSPSDPNSMQGPPGYSTAAFVGSRVPWQYTIYFENESNALAFARQIVITNVLNPSFDIRTFRVSEIAFGDVTIKVPANRSFYQTRVAAPSQNPTNVVVDVTAGVDVQHNTVFWTLNAIDLNTGQLPDQSFEGVLPPDSPDPVGVGHVTFTIQPAAGVPTGTVITNEASIVFDNNDPINTNPTTNTVDAVPPTSTVLNYLPATLTTNFTVTWFGTDDPNGSGVADYDIYVSDNNGPWQPWQMAIAATSATYSGQPGHTYEFYSVAHDNSGNIQPMPTNYEALTFVSTNQTPTLQPIADQTLLVGKGLALTNLTSTTNGSQKLTFSLQNAPAGAFINRTNGNFSWAPACDQGSTTNLITIWATDSGSPPLSNSVTFAVVVGECVQVSIGSTVMQIGTTSSVPVNLLSTVALTNLSFVVNYPSNRFANWALAPSNAAIGGVTAGALDSDDASFSLGTKSGQVFQGPGLAGSAAFSAVSNSSAFVPLTIENIQGTKSDGTLVGNTFGVGGRVVVIGAQPLLEAWMATNSRMLTIYGNPGSSYLALFNTNLLTTNWQAGWRIPQTNLSQSYEANEQWSPVFYRALQFSANPPIVELNSINKTNLILVLYGEDGTNYIIQATTNLSLTNGWFTTTNFTLTNSFEFFGTGSPTNKAMFFRAKRP